MRNFTTYIKTLVFAGLALLGSFSVSAQSYAEGADLPTVAGTPYPTFTFGSAGTFTVSGTVTTPGDFQDAFNVNIPAGFQITEIDYNIGGPASFNGFMDWNLSNDATFTPGNGGGTYALSYPISSGTYIAYVAANFSVGNTWTYTFTVTSTGGGGGAPANDDVCNAIPLSTGVNGPYDNTGATAQAGEVMPPLGADCHAQTNWCNGTTLGKTIWFTFTASSSGHDTILAPGYDTELAIWDAPSCSSFSGWTLIAANDDEGENHGGVSFSSWVDAKCLIPGHTYYVQLQGYNGATGSTTLNLGSVANQVPTISSCPSSFTTCSANPTWTAPTASDPEGCSVTLTPDHASGSSFPVGPTTVTYTATDNLGATSTCSFTVTRTAAPTVNSVSDQTVCEGSNTTTVTFSGTATSYDWTGSSGAIGLATSGSGNIASFTTVNASNAPITDVITVTPNTPGCPSGTSTSFDITVNPIPDVDPVSNQVVCNGSSTTTVSFTGSVSGTTFSWTGTNGTIGIATSGNGNIASFTATNTGTSPVTDNITVTPSYTNNGVTCDGAPTTFSITVNPTPDVNPTADQTVCNGSNTTTVSFTGSVSGTSFDWTGTDGTIGIATSGNGDIASFTATNTGTAPVTDVITVTPSYTNAGQTCTGASDNFDITVNPTPDVNGVSDQVVCNNGSTTTVSFTGSVAGTSYDWTGTDGTIGIATSGNGDIASFTATNTGTSPVTDVITVTPSYTNNGVTCTGTPTSFSITVNPTPDVNPTADQTVCNGSNTTAVSFTGSVSGTSYDWTGTDGTIGIATSGNGDIASFTATNTGTTPVTDAITVTPSYTNAGLTCVGAADNFDIVVNPTPDVNPVSDQVNCHLTPTNAVTFTGTVPGTSFDWTGTDGSIGLATSGSGDIASFTAINGGTSPKVDVITVTPNYTNAGATCPGAPTSFSYTVNPIPLFDPPAADQTVCNGSNTAPVNFTVTVSGSNVDWTGTDGTIGLATSGNGNIASFTATNTGTTPVVDVITATPSYTNAGLTCTGSSDDFNITVNPTPNVDPVADQVVCNGAPTTTASFTGTVPGTVYNWTGTDGTIGIATSGSGDIASFNAINNGNTPVTDVITVTPSYTNNGVTCDGTSITFSITVNPTPNVDPVADQFVCNNNPTTAVNFTSTVAGTSYDWTGTDGTIGLATSGNGDIASFTATNPGNTAVTDVITVTPSYTNAGVTCVGSSIDFDITVNPTPIMTPNADQEVCNGAATTAVTFASSVAGTKYDWTSSNPTVGVASSATNVSGFPSFTAINTTTSDVIDTIVVTPTSPDLCVGPNDTFTITIHPTPVVDLGPNVTTCGGNVVLDAANPGSSYAWSNGVTTQLDTVSAGGLYSVTVTTIYGCIDSDNVNIYIKPTPAVNLGADATYCGGTVTLDAGNVGDTYLWSTGATTQQITVGSTNAYSVIVTDTASGCQGFDTINLTFNTMPVVNLGPDTTLCGGTLTLLAGDPLNTYNWSTTSTSNSITVTTTGTYSVTVNYPNGCSATGSIHVTIFSKPDLGPDFTDSICPGSTADLNSYFVASGLTMSYSSATPGTVGTGIYRAIGVNANGCSDTVFVTIIDRVKPDLGVDKTDSICPGYTYDLQTLYPNAGYTSYTWSGTFTPSAVGPGTYTLVVTNASGCSDTAVATIINSQKPNLGGNKVDSICLHTTYDLTALYPVRGYASYTTNAPDSSAVTAGTYQIVVTNAQGCSDTAYATIINRVQPVVMISEPVGVCSTEPAFTLQGGAPAGGTYFINNVVSSLFDPATLGAGPQRVVYAYTNASGCTDSAVTTITVYPQPVITDTVSFPPVCTNSQALNLNTYFTPAGGVFSGAGVSGTYFYPTLTSTGPTQITYILTDQHGCSDTSVRTLTVLPQVQVTLHTSVSNMTICSGQEITFTAAGATDYQFFVNGVAVTSVSDTNTYTTTTLQNHDQVTVVGSNGCSSMTSDFIIIDVNPAVVADAGRDTTIDLGQTVQLQGSATGGTGNLTYNWLPTVGLDLSNVPNPKFSGSDTTLFTLRVTDANGCWDTATVTVNVRVPENVLLPNVLTPNGDGQNDMWVLNPKINLAGSHLLIFNRWGEKVYEADSYANNWQGTYMNTNDKLPDGTYYYVLKVPAQNNHEYTGPINLLSTQK